MLVVLLAAINAAEPLDLPLPATASAPHSPGPVEPAAFGQDRPGRADRTIALGPVGRHNALEQPATGLEHGERQQVGHGGQGAWIDPGRGGKSANLRRVLSQRGGEQPHGIIRRRSIPAQ